MHTIKMGNVNTQIKTPEICPICKAFIDVNFITEKLNTKTSIFQIVFRCPRHDCQELFIAYYKFDMTRASARFTFIEVKPNNFEIRQFSREILNISSSFSEIYNQAYQAEQSGLNLICGPGYRKALEYLIKDYLIFTNADDQEKIKKKPLIQCIHTLNSINIKLCAERATWIGNDETHYTKVWVEKDITHLKELIDLSIHWISSEIITKNYQEDMPKTF